MSGMRQKIQYSLALEPAHQGETPVGGCQGTEPVVAKPAPQSPALASTPCRCPSLTPSNRRVRDPYARWCGRGGTARCPLSRSSSQIGREHEFRAVYQFPTSNAAGRRSRAAPAQRSTQQLKGQTLCFECLDHATREAMTDQCRKHLHVGVKTQARSIERRTALDLEIIRRRQLKQRRRVEPNR